jgi:hypothetical protein
MAQALPCLSFVYLGDLMKIKSAFLGAAFASLLLASPAGATVINFDDISTSSFTGVTNGYDGFDWHGVDVIVDTFHPGTGYQYGVVSGPNAAFDDGGFGATFYVASGTFTLNSAYFTGAYYNQNVTVKAYNGDTLVDTVTFAVSDTSPTLETFNWAGITTVNWKGSSTVHYQSQIVVDNLTVNQSVNAVPETSTWAMMLAGFAGLGVLGWRRNKAATFAA